MLFPPLDWRLNHRCLPFGWDRICASCILMNSCIVTFRLFPLADWFKESVAIWISSKIPWMTHFVVVSIIFYDLYDQKFRLRMHLVCFQYFAGICPSCLLLWITFWCRNIKSHASFLFVNGYNLLHVFFLPRRGDKSAA